MVDFPVFGALLPEQVNMTYIVIFTGIMVIYFLIRPLINWIIASRSVKLLNYILTSFVMLIFLLGGVVLTSMFQLPLLEVTLHSLAAFGGFLVIVHVIQSMFQNKKKRV